MRTMRLGGIGAGRVLRRAHIPAYVHLDSVRLTAVYDPDRGAAEEARQVYIGLMREQAERCHDRSLADVEVSVCSSPEELLGQVDLVDICAPARWHARYAAMALERNVHAMTEKPMARTWWEAQHVLEIARRSHASFQLNDDNLFLPRYRALRNVIESGMIGDVQSIWLTRGGPTSAAVPWFWEPMEAGGGCLMNYGSHAVASTWFLVGYDKVPVEVRSLGIQTKHRTRMLGGRYRQVEIDDDAHFKIRFVNPVNGDWSTVVVEATHAYPDLGPNGNDVRGYIEVLGSTGTASGYVDDQDRHYIRVRNRVFGERLIALEAAATERESFQGEIRNLVECIAAGVPSILNAKVGASVMAILTSAQLSELRGRKHVTIDEMAEFSRQTAGDAPDPWQGADRIVAALMEPYRST